MDDYQQVQQLCYRYAQAVDRRDMAALGQLFTPDAVLIVKTNTMVGRDNIVGAMTALDAFSVTQHHVNNVVATIVGNQASLEVYCIAMHITSSDAGLSRLDWGVRYQDQLRKNDEGEWQFCRRELLVDWEATQELSA